MPLVRDNATIGPFADGAAVEVRAFISRLTTKDPILLAVKLRPEKPLGEGHPWLEEDIDVAAALAQLTFEVDGPGGKQKLVVANPPKQLMKGKLADFRQAFAITGAGLTPKHAYTRAELWPWAAPQPALLEKPGKYTVTISGELATSARTLAVTSKPIELEIVEAGPAHKTLAELEAEVHRIVNHGQEPTGFSPAIRNPPVDDVQGNLSFELQGVAMGYDLKITEVVVDAAGKQLLVNEYTHFTCVAEGTLVDTPTGRVPIESLRVGDRVDAFDVEAGRAAVATILQIEHARAAEIVTLGELRATGIHPVFADGAWTRADEVRPGARLLRADGSVFEVMPVIEETHAVVYDLSVTAPHTFFAGGVLVHNKAIGVPLHGGAPWGGWFSRMYETK